MVVLSFGRDALIGTLFLHLEGAPVSGLHALPRAGRLCGVDDEILLSERC